MRGPGDVGAVKEEPVRKLGTAFGEEGSLEFRRIQVDLPAGHVLL